jgi:hypothetical protein
MAAGLGFKTFTTGEVLTAADTNGYLMQGVLVFASAAARDAAITSPQEGQCCYLKDTDAVLTYSGAAWVGFDDSNAIQNSIVDAKGDLITATAADTPSRIAVGANNTVLTADSAQATGLKWATPSTSLTLAQIATGSFSGTSVTISSLSAYDTIILSMTGVTWATADDNIRVRINSVTGSSYVKNGYAIGSGGVRSGVNQTATSFALQDSANQVRTDATNNYFYIFTNAKSVGFTSVIAEGFYNGSGTPIATSVNGIIIDASTVASLVLATSSGYTFSAGTYTVWGG